MCDPILSESYRYGTVSLKYTAKVSDGLQTSSWKYDTAGKDHKLIFSQKLRYTYVTHQTVTFQNAPETLKITLTL